MKLAQLTLTHFRAEKFNLIIGDNSSGKTSLLEVIYFLGINRFFRNRLRQPVIQRQQRFCQIVGDFSSIYYRHPSPVVSKTVGRIVNANVSRGTLMALIYRAN